MKLCSIQNINTGNPNSIIRNPCSLWYNPMFIINLSKITWVAFHPKHQSINYFSQSIRNVSNNFHFLIGFLRVNWNDMFTALVFWHCQRSKFYAYGILKLWLWWSLIHDWNFATQRQAIVALYGRRQKTSDFCFVSQEPC